MMSFLGAALPSQFDMSSLNDTLQVVASVTATPDIEFGIDGDGEFFVHDNGEGEVPELAVTLDVTISTVPWLGGRIGPLSAGIVNGHASVGVELSLDLVDPDAPSIGITWSEFTDSETDTIFPSMTGDASLTLPLALRLGDDGMGVTSTYTVRGQLASPMEFVFGPGGSSDWIDGFSPMQFEMGDFVGQVLGPVLENVNEYNPIPPDLLSFMDDALPILDVVPLDLLGVDNADEIKLVWEIANLIGSLPSGGNSIDLSTFFDDASPPTNPGDGSPDGGNTGPFDEFLQELRDDYSVALPVLEDLGGSVLSLLNGEDVDLIRWDPDEFTLSKTYSYSFPLATFGIPFLAEATISAFIEGGFELFGNLDLGLTTRGLRDPDGDGQRDLLDGFFIGDNKPDPQGEDAREAGFRSHIAVGISATAKVLSFIELASITGSGGIAGEIGFDFSDVAYGVDGLPESRVGRGDDGGDNRVYLDELQWLTQNYGPLCAISPGGDLSAYLKVTGEIEILGEELWSDEAIPYNHKIIDWEIPCGGLTEATIADVVGDSLVMRNDATTGGRRIDVFVMPNAQHEPQALRIQRSSDTHWEPAELCKWTTFTSPVTVTSPCSAVPGAPEVPWYVNVIDSWQGQVLVAAGWQRQTFDISELEGVTTLVVEGSDGPDEISISPAVTEDLPFTHMTVNTGHGSNRLHFGRIDPLVSNLVETTVNGGNEDDRIWGTFARDVVYGGGGSDRISTGEGDDEIDGGLSADIIYSGRGNDTVRGGGGSDQIYEHSGLNLIYGDGDPPGPLDGQLNHDWLFGGADADTIYGNEGNDVIIGFEGDDLIEGGSEDDDIQGNEGNDTVHAGPGLDTVYGQQGQDEIYGDEGADTLFGGDDRDKIYGGDDRDEISGGDERDTLYGGDGGDLIAGNEHDDVIWGDDHLVAGGGDDTIWGNSGNDTIYGGGGHDQIEGNEDDDEIWGDDALGSSGNDTILGQTGQDLIYGGAGFDTIDAGDEDDTIFGGDHDDVIIAGFGQDSVEGNGGDDEIWGGHDYFEIGDGSDTIHGGTGSDTIYGCEGSDWIDGNEDGDEIWGERKGIGAEEANDTIFGSSGNDTIFGGDGDDWIDAGSDDDKVWGDEKQEGTDASPTIDDEEAYARHGNDTILGNTGLDTLRGGAGNDWIEGNEDDDEIYGEAHPDTILGYGGDDKLHGGRGEDFVYGHLGNDTIYGGRQNDRLEGDEGHDLIWGDDDPDNPVDDMDDDYEDDDVIWGLSGNDTLIGGRGADRIEGGEDDDDLQGGEGNDTLRGQAGNDWIYGDQDQDELYGGAGVDTIYGGHGDDLLVAGTGVGDVLIGDSGDDRIFGSDEGTEDANFADGTYFGDVIIGGSGNDSIWSLGGADIVDGSEGDDFIDAGVHADLVHGGPGDDLIYAGRSTLDQLYGDAGSDTIYGSHVGNDIIYGGDDNDTLYGQDGDDSLYGESGGDLLDGGADTDSLFGGDGNDELRGGGGVGDRLDGGPDDDVLRGSDDGADLLIGGSGRDRLLGNAGNDVLRGGDDDDVIDGGPGDDTAMGEAGSDLILGGADHDLLYGHDAAATTDDGAVDYVYGDFGTNGGEPGSGRDQIYGNDGNDLLFGEGDDDLIVAGSGGDNLVDYGSGESATPADFTAPPATADPPLATPPEPVVWSAMSLPTGDHVIAPWWELTGSASGRGLSGDPGLSLEPSVMATADARYVAWSDSRNGNFEIYVARHINGAWEPLSGTAGHGGISSSSGSSRRPSITLGTLAQPIVAWTEFSDSGASDIHVATFDPAAQGGAGDWVSLGSSRDAGGISNTGVADHAVVVQTSAGPVVSWLDHSSGMAQVYVAQFSGGVWQPLGPGATSGGGVSNAASDASDLALATDGSKVAVAWTQTVADRQQVYLKEFSAGNWIELDGSASDGGVSDTEADSCKPTLSYHDGSLFAAWQSRVDWGDAPEAQSRIDAARYDGSTWLDVGGDSLFDNRVLQNNAQSVTPELASAGDSLYLLWVNTEFNTQPPDIRPTHQSSRVNVRRWDGATFVAETAGSANYGGVYLTNALIDLPALAVDPQGHPLAAWQDSTSGSPEIYLQADLFDVANTYYVNDSNTTEDQITTAAGSSSNSGLSPDAPKASVQEVLDTYALGPGDLILVDTATKEEPLKPVVAGTYPGFSVSAADSGFVILGASGVWGNPEFSTVDLNQAVGVTLAQFRSNITLTQSEDVTVRAFRGSMTIHGGRHILVQNSNVWRLTVSDEADAVEVRHGLVGQLLVTGLGRNEYQCT